MAESSDRVPESRALALVQDFVNTRHSGGDEDLASPAAAVEWLRTRAFNLTLSGEQHHRLLEVRELLRTLFAVNAGEPLSAEAAVRLSQLLQRTSVRPEVAADGVRLVAASDGIEGFLGTIVATLVESTVDGRLARMKVCRADDCLWAFYDNSKNGSGAWCSMRSCGTRAKARAYRERQRER